MTRLLALLVLLAAATPPARGDGGPGATAIRLTGDRLWARLDRAPLPAVLAALAHAGAIDVVAADPVPDQPVTMTLDGVAAEAGIATPGRVLVHAHLQEQLAAIAERP